MALVGESGSGKCIVIKLIQRFYNPESGQIFLNGMKIQKFKLSWLRQEMGLVSQEPIPSDKTIRENIAYGKTGLEQKERPFQQQELEMHTASYQDCLKDTILTLGTTIVVANCLTTIMGADTIAVVKNRVIVEKRSQDVLIKMKDGVYASLVAIHSSSE
ncbi:ABC transporter B family member 9-like [Olea europaea subsp. europaea]|uniref:ABC transporter B family member 9-like n=1 Tax=Olea europaea subsp. europaea TaxID=158383 RepID=A0A8S0V7K7_OLEEU|nr:ABC transporter B family member 9-like [Olea europaea subsp. europaea]